MTRVRPLLLLLVLLAAALYALHGVLLSAAGSYLVAEDPLERADVIIVLAGNSPYRAAHAVELFHAGWAPRLVLSDEHVRSHGLDTTWSQLYNEGTARLEVPRSAIVVLPGLPDSTYDEALRNRDLMLTRGWRRAILVTDPFHSHRALLLFRDTFGPSGLDVRSSPAMQSPAGVEGWWTSTDGVQRVVSEYVKLAWAMWTVDPLLPFR